VRPRRPERREGADRGGGFVVRLPHGAARVAATADRAPPRRSRDRHRRPRPRGRRGPFVDRAVQRRASPARGHGPQARRDAGHPQRPHRLVGRRGRDDRPAPAHGGGRALRLQQAPSAGGPPDDLEADIRDMLEQLKRIPRFDADHYVAALRDWVRHGASSRYSLAPEDVLRRSAPRSRAVAEAAAEFDLGQHLHHAGYVEDARTHFRAAHRLQPENWTYKRTAWELVSPGLQGPTAFYDGDWLADIKAAGPENYYAAPDF